MSLLTFWPTEKNILDCIKPEAENPLDAVFLAIHQPMKLKRRRFGCIVTRQSCGSAGGYLGRLASCQIQDDARSSGARCRATTVPGS